VVAFSRRDPFAGDTIELVVVPAGRPDNLSVGATGQGERDLYYPMELHFGFTWSPTGQEILFTKEGRVSGPDTLAVVASDGSYERTVGRGTNQ
jgi:hypothetical protein